LLLQCCVQTCRTSVYIEIVVLLRLLAVENGIKGQSTVVRRRKEKVVMAVGREGAAAAVNI
jgi:hypothetical protein